MAVGRRRVGGAAALKTGKVQGHAGSGGLGGSDAVVCQNLAPAECEGGEVDAVGEAHCSLSIGYHLLLREDRKTAAA
jgi:hypothetical protein